MKLAYSEFYNRKKILITGHTGFIGSWLVKWLSMLNSEICGYSVSIPSKPSLYELLTLPGLIFDIRGDIRDKELLKRTIFDFQPEIVIHLVAQPLVQKSYEIPYETFEVNVLGTVNLLEILRGTDSVKTILVMTSDKVYENTKHTHRYRETDPLKGKDPYSASKSCQDIVVNSYRESYFTETGVGLSSIRAGNVIGGGDWAQDRIVPDLVKGLTDERTVRIRNPNAVRPWQHVLDLSSGILQLGKEMSTKIKFSGDWNFGSSDPRAISVKQLTEKFMIVWGTGTYEYSKKGRNKEAKYLLLDSSKSRRRLRWTPIYRIEDSIRKTAEWYKAYYENCEMDLTTTDQIVDYNNSLINSKSSHEQS